MPLTALNAEGMFQLTIKPYVPCIVVNAGPRMAWRAAIVYVQASAWVTPDMVGTRKPTMSGFVRPARPPPQSAGTSGTAVNPGSMPLNVPGVSVHVVCAATLKMARNASNTCRAAIRIVMQLISAAPDVKLSTLCSVDLCILS